MNKKVVVIGGGLVGSLLSIFLIKRGFQVSIYERRKDIRKDILQKGRSVNLALSARGIYALKEVGILDDILSITIAMHGRVIHNLGSRTSFQPYGSEGQSIYSVSRRELNCKLLDKAEQLGVKILFNQNCIYIDWEKSIVTFEFAKGKTEKSHIDAAKQSSSDFSLCFGCDGINSFTRSSFSQILSDFNIQENYIEWGYKELFFSNTKFNDSFLEKNAFHVWPRNDYMLIALPNPNGSFTGTLFFPLKDENLFGIGADKGSLALHLNTNFPDIEELIPDFVEQISKYPTSKLSSIKCFPWTKGDFCLFGDAAHAILPFFGQGMNAGFEDCTVLNKLIDVFDNNWNEILDSFQKLRKPDTDSIADLAFENFTELSTNIADPRFLLQKKIEHKMHLKHFDKWIPAYSQVTFYPQIRYSEAKLNIEKQQNIMKTIMSQSEIESTWDSNEIEQQILSMLGKI